MSKRSGLYSAGKIVSGLLFGIGALFILFLFVVVLAILVLITGMDCLWEPDCL